MVSRTSVVRVLSTTAMQTTLEALVGELEQTSGIRLALDFGPSGRIAKRVEEGAAADVAIVTASGIDALIGAGRITAGTRTDIAVSKVGVAVQRGAARPDIATVEGFRRAMLAARRVAMSNPTGGAQSGAHLARVFERLGIADGMAPKSIYGPGGPEGLIGKFLLRNEADVGLQQLPELMSVPGIDVIGPLPDEIGLATIFSAGLSAAAVNPEGGRALLAGLRSPAAAEVMARMGMQPA
jgi:molybdate transport system substrate-binding protein